MNIAKDKMCIFKADEGEHKAQCSLVMLVTTVGVKPRKQKTTKAVHVCFKHLPLVSDLLTVDAESPSLDSLAIMCERANASHLVLRSHDAATAVAVTVKEAANALNRQRWHVLKKGKS